MHCVSRVIPRVRKVAELGGESLTKQSMAAGCDINLIMARYLKFGAVDHVAKHGGSYGFASALTFHDAMNVVRKAEEMFADLSSEVRTRFGNDPAAFLTFVQDEKNIDEMRKLGLAKPASPAEPAPVDRRVAELEVDSAARLAIARRAMKAPSEAPPHS